MKAIFTISLLLLSLSVFADDFADHFVTTWKTDNPGPSNDTSIIVPMKGGPYDIDWNNDGVFDEFGINGTATHDYMVAGTYTIRIRGSYDSIRFAFLGDRKKIVSLDQWGTNPWTSMDKAFSGTINLQIPATDTPDFSAVTNMSGMFNWATLANPDTRNWNTSAVTNMQGMFTLATSANPDTSNWDTSNVRNMQLMFKDATSANPDTSAWDTSAVTGMSGMFSGAGSANPDTSSWITSAVTDMSDMFSQAVSANPDTSSWDLSAVKKMPGIFAYATSANPDTSSWDMSGVVEMAFMFRGAISAEPDTSSWDTSSARRMRGMFESATSANPDTSGWDTSGVTTMSGMFAGATSANPDTSGWETSAVVNMSSMFAGATAANPDTSGWDTSEVVDMTFMFRHAHSANPITSSWNTSSVELMPYMFDHATSANPDVSNWDTGAVRRMEQMFFGATSFDQNLGAWDVTALKTAWYMFRGVTLSTANYEALLIGWSGQNLRIFVWFDGGNSTYCSADAAAAKRRMIAGPSWRITDGGLGCKPTGINATDGDYPNLVQVTFNPVAGATVYRVFRCLDSGYTCGLPIGYVTTPTFNDTKGNFEQVYYYRVQACMESDCSKFSVADTGFTAPAPDRPTEIRATDGIFEDRVQVTFNTVEGATVYRVFRCPDRGYTCGLPIGYPKTGTFEDRKGDAGTVYYYRVRACTATTCGKFSVANAGHRATVPVAESDESEVIVLGVPGQSLNDVPIPSLNDLGRWLLILMTLGVGLLLISHRYQEKR